MSVRVLSNEHSHFDDAYDLIAGPIALRFHCHDSYLLAVTSTPYIRYQKISENNIKIPSRNGHSNLI